MILEARSVAHEKVLPTGGEKQGMPEHDPVPRRRLSVDEARTVRRWIIGLLAASVMLSVIAPTTTVDQDRVISLLAAATMATGAVVVRRPVGFRIILALATLVAAVAATGRIHL